MIRTKQILFGFLCLVICVWSGCSYSSKDVNDKAVEKLRLQLLDNRFDDVYDKTSNITRTQVTREEFLGRIRAATIKLKGIDSELNWHRVEISPEPAVYRDDNWSSLNLENDGRKVNVQLDWDPPFDLCGMSISGDIPEGGISVFRNCD